MHSPNEMVELGDLEDCARLISVYIKGLGPDTDFVR
jgi:endoglucanase